MKKYLLILFLLIFASCKLFEKELNQKDVFGCMDSTSMNFNPEATIDDDSCDYCSDTSSVIMITYDGGITWNAKCINILIERIIDISIVDSNNIWICTEPGLSRESIIIYTDNGGYTWQEQYNNYENNCYLNYIKMFDENNGIVFGDGKKEEKVNSD